MSIEFERQNDTWDECQVEFHSSLQIVQLSVIIMTGGDENCRCPIDSHLMNVYRLIQIAGTP